MIKLKGLWTAVHNAKANVKEDPDFLGLCYVAFGIEIWIVRSRIDLPGRKHIFWIFYKYVGY